MRADERVQALCYVSNRLGMRVKALIVLSETYISRASLGALAVNKIKHSAMLI